MKPQTEAMNSDLTDDEDLEDLDDQWISKSQLKRDSKDLQKLGKKLVAYTPQQLSRIPLNDTLLDAIHLAHKLLNKRAALKRHFQFIGKILRSIDTDPIFNAVSVIENDDQGTKLLFKKIENWRDRILETGDLAINECCDAHAQIDRQKLRQLGRNYRQAPSEEKKTQVARQIFKELRISMAEG